MFVSRLLAVLACLACAVVPAGCGGSGNESGGGTTTTRSTTTAGSTGQGRLSPTSWATYTDVRDHARTVNTAAIKTFQKCRGLDFTSVSTEKIQSCLGDSTSSVVTEGQMVLKTLGGFEGEAGGACATALTQLEGNVHLYVASVNTLTSTVQRGSPAGAPAQIDSATTALAHSRASQAAFESACKPA
jgi:hypothetical protein